MNLAELKKHQRATVIGYVESTIVGAAREIDRLIELGITIGSEVEILHEGPFGRDPIAVRVRGGLLGLRRDEADQVQVALEVKKPS